MISSFPDTPHIQLVGALNIEKAGHLNRKNQHTHNDISRLSFIQNILLGTGEVNYERLCVAV